MLACASGEFTNGPKFDATPTEGKCTPASIIFVQLNSNKTYSKINIYVVLLFELGSGDGMSGGGRKDHSQAQLQIMVTVFFLSLWILSLIVPPSTRDNLNDLINKIFPKRCAGSGPNI